MFAFVLCCRFEPPYYLLIMLVCGLGWLWLFLMNSRSPLLCICTYTADPYIRTCTPNIHSHMLSCLPSNVIGKLFFETAGSTRHWRRSMFECWQRQSLTCACSMREEMKISPLRILLLVGQLSFFTILSALYGFTCHYSGTSNKWPSMLGITSLQSTLF